MLTMTTHDLLIHEFGEAGKHIPRSLDTVRLAECIDLYYPQIKGVCDMLEYQTEIENYCKEIETEMQEAEAQLQDFTEVRNNKQKENTA